MKHVRRRCGYASWLVLTTISLCANAQGVSKGPISQEDATGEARGIYAEGANQYDRGQYDQAIVSFERAYGLSHAPAILFNIAQAYRLKTPWDCTRALRYYERVLEENATAPNRDEIRDRISEM